MVCLLFIQVNQIAWFQMMFYLNQSSIAKTNCERVVLNCNGKCYLAKQMAKNTEQPATTNPKTSSTKIIELISLEYVGFQFPNSYHLIGNLTFTLSIESLTGSDFLYSEFRPPKIS